MTLGWRLSLIGLATLGLLTMITLGCRHYEGLISQINTLEADKAALAVALENERAVARGLQEGIVAWSDAYDQLATRQAQAAAVAQAATAEARRLNELLAEHDLATLARRKPALVEARVNAGTRRALSLLECASTPGGCPPDGVPATADDSSPAAPGAARPAPGGVGRRDP